MLYNDIKPYIDCGSYAVDINWGSLESWIKNIGTEILFEPDFQRAHVWTEDQQRAYIEHIFRRGRSGKDIWWNCSTWSGCEHEQEPLILVDGLQRITAVRKFMRDELRVFGDSRRSDFRYRSTSGVLSPISHFPLECDFKMHVNSLQTRREVLEWYLQINDGGTPHTQQELDKVRRML